MYNLEVEGEHNYFADGTLVSNCHNVSSLYGRQSVAFRVLGKNIPRKIGMSGTPLLNYPIELWPTVSLLWPNTFDSIYDFAERYCEGDKVNGRWKWKGARNLIELRQKLLRLGLIARFAADVLPELPARRREVLVLPLSDRAEYERANKEFLPWLASWDPDRARSAERNQQLVKFGYMKRLAGQLKVDAVSEWVGNFLRGSTGKCLVFGCHRETVLDPLFEKYKGMSTWIVGGMTDATRQAAEDRFQTDPECRLLWGQIRACGEGRNLTAADVVFFAELDFNHARHTQAERRALRFGRQAPVRMVYAVAAGTLEELLCEMIDEKQKTFNQVLRGTADAADDLDLYDELTRRILGSSRL